MPSAMTTETAAAMITRAARAHVARRQATASAVDDGPSGDNAAQWLSPPPAPTVDCNVINAAASDAGRKLFIGRIPRRTTEEAVWT